MATLQVGPTRTYKTIASAVSKAAANDRIEVDAGEYLDDVPPVLRVNLTFVAVGGRVTCKTTKLISNGKGIFIAGGSSGYPSISFDGFSFVGAKVTDRNGAAIRWQAGDLTITNCIIDHCEDGVLATPFVKGTGTVSIDRTEVRFCGAGDGQSHALYIGAIARLTVTNSYIHDTAVGHHIKTRAANTTISGCRLLDLAGTSSYSVDVPNAGNVTISNTSIQQGRANQNPYIFTYGVGGASNTGRNALVTTCKIVNDATSVKLCYNSVLDDVFLLTDCSFYGVPNTITALGKGPVKLQNPTWLTSRPFLDSETAPYSEAAQVMEQGDSPDPVPPLPAEGEDPEPDDEE